MYPITCPHCGRKGSIPNDHYRGRLHCAKCDAVFHMARNGHFVLGEPDDAPTPSGDSPAPRRIPAPVVQEGEQIPVSVVVCVVFVLIAVAAWLLGIWPPGRQ